MQPIKCFHLCWEGTPQIKAMDISTTGDLALGQKYIKGRTPPPFPLGREVSRERKTTVAAHTEGSVLGTSGKISQYEESLAVGKVQLIRTVC